MNGRVVKYKFARVKYLAVKWHSPKTFSITKCVRIFKKTHKYGEMRENDYNCREIKLCYELQLQ